MSQSANWLRNIKIGSKNKFQNWLMTRVGFESYLRNKLWDDQSLFKYIIETRGDNLYFEFLDEQNKVTIVDFKTRAAKKD